MTRSDTHRLVLFVAGNEPNSRLARENLERITATEAELNVSVEIVDVFSDTEQAMQHMILVTPALLKVGVEPRVLVIGTLSDLDAVRSALGLPSEGEANHVEREQTA